MPGDVASKDDNNVSSLLGVSSADGTTPVKLYASPTSHRLLVDGVGVTGPQGPTGPTGAFSGPGASTDNALVRWDGTAGTTVQNSSVTVDDAKTGVGSTVLFSQTQAKQVVNTVVETSIDGSGVGSKTLPANFLIAGRTLKITAAGIHSSSSGPTITIKVKLGGSTILLTSGAVSSGTSTNTYFEVKALITCYTDGATGTVWSQGFYTEAGGGANAFPMTNTAATTVDTTATQDITVTVEWGTASNNNTITCTNLVIEALN